MTKQGFLHDAFARAGLDAGGVASLAKVMAEDFVEYQYARLEEAGAAPHERVRLGQVFVDLSVSRNVSEVVASNVPDDQKPFGCLAALAADLPQLKGRWHGNARDGERPELCLEGHVLLVGGPGQGKSTLVQHLVQGHRWQCLRDVEGLKGVVGFTEAMRCDALERRLEHRPARTRLPIEVRLAEFAAWRALRNEIPEAPVLLRYVAQKLWRGALGVDDLDRLLKRTPWLLVLDGLDEVPAARDRAIALQCIEAFFDAHGLYGGEELRPLVVATTRPQGWGEEFASHLPLYLVPLSLPEAITYAASVTAARYPTQARLRERVDERFRAATAEPAMTQLLRSPLLVAIMTRLIAEQGQAPRLRWEVFERFYETIYHRELSRNTALSAVLAQERPIIHELHRHTGLVLHARSERERGSASTVSRAWLREAALRLTEADDVAEAQRVRRVDALIDAVEQRLVLLVEGAPDAFSYELRSFQEFMAAWALTTGTDADVKARFERIATSSAWRNVLLLALGRLFAERSPHREALSVGLCAWLEDAEANPLAALAHEGAALALEILHDGLAAHSPKVVAELTELALGVLDCPVAHWRGGSVRAPKLIDAVRMASAQVERDFVAELRRRIEERLADESAHVASWYVLTTLALDDAEGDALASRRWDTLTIGQQDALVQRTDAAFERLWWMAGRVARAWRHRDPVAFLDLPFTGYGGAERDAWELATGDVVRRPLDLSETSFAVIRQRPVCAEPSRVQALHTVVAFEAVPAAWRPLQVAAAFRISPGPEELAVAFERLTPLLPEARRCSSRLPWLLALFVHHVDSPRDAVRFADRARRGDFGTLERWRAIEQEAAHSPVVVQELKAMWSDPDPLYAAVRSGRWWTLESEPVAREAVDFGEEARFGLHLLAVSRHLAATRRPAVVGVAAIALRLGAYSLEQQRPPDGLWDDVQLPDGVPLASYVVASGVDPEKAFWKEHFRKCLHAGLGSPVVALGVQRRVAADAPGALMARTLCGIVGNDDPSPVAFDDPDLRTCAAVLALLRPRFDDLHTLASMLVTSSWDARPLLLTHMFFAPAFNPTALLQALLQIPHDHALLDQCRAVAARWLWSVDTGLANAKPWRELGFLAPSPEQPTSPAAPPPSPSPATPEAIVTLNEVHATALRALADVRFTPARPLPERGQWVVLLGENGSGKTTLLRGIALALTERDNATSALNDARAWYVRHGATRGSCAVTLDGRAQTLTIVRHPDKESPGPNGVVGALPWVVAYGCRRGGALGGRDPDRSTTRFADVATLFDDERGLIDVPQWILTQEAASPNDPFAKLAYDVVTRALGDVLEHNFLSARSTGLWVKPRGGGEDIQFASLSDGFLTTAGWIGDLLVRYVERHRGHPERLSADFPKRMTGVVVLDEIDQHLHPRWQVKIIGQVRSIFPRMTFVVTTHNPLTIAGARREEVFLMERDARGDVTVEPARFDPRLRTGTELFSKFFGIGDVFPNELGRKLHRYGALASNPYRTDDEQAELDAISALLVREGVEPGFAPEPRVADP